MLQSPTSVSRRGFLAFCGVGAMGAAALLTSCVSNESQSETSESSATQETDEQDAEFISVEDTESTSVDAAGQGNKGAIVVYFSRAGENYEVGTIEVGNTAIVAQMIADETGADIQEIVPATPYSESYDECLDEAKAEQNSNARPALSAAPDVSGYETVYLGYPLWWRDLPMCVYTYLESQDWEGKAIVPFCTHGGSGLMNTVASIADVCAGATVLDALSISGKTAQFDRDATLQAVREFLGTV